MPEGGKRFSHLQIHPVSPDLYGRAPGDVDGLLGRIELLEGRAPGDGADGRVRIELLDGRAPGDVDGLLGRIELPEGRAPGDGTDGRVRIELLDGRAPGDVDGLLGRIELPEGRAPGDGGAGRVRIELLDGRAPGDGGRVREFELTVVRAGGLGRLVAEDFVPGLVGRSGLVPATPPGRVGTSVGRCRIDAGTADGEIAGFPELGSLTTSSDVFAPGGKDKTSGFFERARGLVPGTAR